MHAAASEDMAAAVWPAVSESHWCGEFAVRAEKIKFAH